MEFTHIKDYKISNKDQLTIRILSYNVHGFKTKSNIKTLDEILTLVSSSDADIVALQEVFVMKRNETVSEDVLINMMKKMGYAQYAFSKCGINAVFSKDEFSHEELSLGRDPIMHLHRNALKCTFPKYDDLLVVNTHLDVFDSSGKTRLVQMRIILDSLAKNNTNKKIVCGDFNSLRKNDYTTDEWNAIVKIDKKRKVDTIEDVIPLIEKSSFVDAFVACKVPLKVTVWSARRIDYIYGNGIDFVQCSVIKNTASDHYPIFTDVLI